MDRHDCIFTIFLLGSLAFGYAYARTLQTSFTNYPGWLDRSDSSSVSKVGAVRSVSQIVRPQDTLVPTDWIMNHTTTTEKNCSKNQGYRFLHALGNLTRIFPATPHNSSKVTAARTHYGSAPKLEPVPHFSDDLNRLSSIIISSAAPSPKLYPVTKNSTRGPSPAPSAAPTHSSPQPSMSESPNSNPGPTQNHDYTPMSSPEYPPFAFDQPPPQPSGGCGLGPKRMPNIVNGIVLTFTFSLVISMTVH